MVSGIRSKNTVIGLALALGAIPVGAQVTVPDVPITAAGVSTGSVTPAQTLMYIAVAQTRIEKALSFRSAHYPKDSMEAALTLASKRWLDTITAHPVRGMQLDPAGGVGAAAGEDAYAAKQIDARLATAGLSFNDKAFAYLTGVMAFASASHPDRLPKAVAYLAGLDKLGVAAAPWQFEARRALADVYYRLGRSPELVQYGSQAMQLVAVMPFYDRDMMYSHSGDLYMHTMEALAGQPNGRTRIAKLNETLRAALVPPPALLAEDSAYTMIGMFYTQNMQTKFEASERLGTRGDPLVSNYWINRATRDSATVPVTDGRIRVIEGGSMGCEACVLGFYRLQELHTRFPGIEPVVFIATGGSWANRLVEADEETTHLNDFFVNTVKATYPIAIWKSKKAVNEDGGTTPESDGPMFQRYPRFSVPTVWVLDGHGIVRQVYLGINRDTEEKIAETIQFLQRESGAPVANNVSLSAEVK